MPSTNRLWPAAITTATVALSTLIASDAAAGFQAPDREYCTAGVCYGTFNGFRNSPYSGDYAAFSAGLPMSANGGYFAASYNGASYSCYVPTNSPLVAGFPGTFTVPYFYVEWSTSTGQCTYIALEQTSEFHSTW
jgi:hypothetical protein